MRAFQEDIDRFEALGIQVLGVSRDSIDTHINFSKDLNISFPLLVDDGTISMLYGKGRLTYLIDTEGVIRFVYQGMPDNRKLIEVFGEL